MAVLVKPNGRLGNAYIAAIRPFRYSVVYPAAGLTEEARRCGAFTAEINPEPGAGTDLPIAGRAEDVLPAIDADLSALGRP